MTVCGNMLVRPCPLTASNKPWRPVCHFMIMCSCSSTEIMPGYLQNNWLSLTGQLCRLLLGINMVMQVTGVSIAREPEWDMKLEGTWDSETSSMPWLPGFPPHSPPWVSLAILHSFKQEQRIVYKPSLHLEQVHPESASRPVITDKWHQECLSPIDLIFGSWCLNLCFWVSTTNLCEDSKLISSYILSIFTGWSWLTKMRKRFEPQGFLVNPNWTGP